MFIHYIFHYSKKAGNEKSQNLFSHPLFTHTLATTTSTILDVQPPTYPKIQLLVLFIIFNIKIMFLLFSDHFSCFQTMQRQIPSSTDFLIMLLHTKLPLLYEYWNKMDSSRSTC